MIRMYDACMMQTHMQLSLVGFTIRAFHCLASDVQRSYDYEIDQAISIGLNSDPKLIIAHLEHMYSTYRHGIAWQDESQSLPLHINQRRSIDTPLLLIEDIILRVSQVYRIFSLHILH